MTPFNRSKFVAFDVETSSFADRPYALQPFRARTKEAYITSYALAYYDSAGALHNPVVHNPSAEQLAELFDWAHRTDRTLVAWNAQFDAGWPYAYGLKNHIARSRWLDAMLLWMHLDRWPESDVATAKRRSYSLKVAVELFIPKYAGYGEGIDFDDMSTAATARRLRYNQMDAAFTLILAEALYNNLLASSEQRLKCALIEARSIGPFAVTNVEGLHIDTDVLDALAPRLEGIAADALAQLEPMGATAEVLASPMQLRELLFEHWGLAPIKNTPKGASSTDKETLHELSLFDDRAALIRKYREALGNRAKFVTAIRNSLDYNGDGVTRPAPRIAGTYTGRATYASKQGRGVAAVPVGFALHQMKRGKEFRDAVTAPPGYTLVEWDAASQEYRWMAIESADETMLSLCEPGEDPHSYMGSRIAKADYRELIGQVAGGDAWAKSSRQLGKVGNLSCQYRTSANKLRSVARVQYNIPMTSPEAVLVHGTYRATYPGVVKYWAVQIALARKRGYVDTIAGRRVSLRGDWRSANERWKMESTSINFPIQGAGADQKYLAIACLQPLLVRYGARMYFELHDGLYVIVPTPKAEALAVEGQRLLNALPYRQAWDFTPPVPLPWDIKIGPAWGSLKELRV